MKLRLLPPMYWLLNGTKNVPAKSLADWAASENRHGWLRREMVRGYYVSTVFLGINHQWVPDEPPILFETMVFDKKKPHDCGLAGERNRACFLDVLQWRYSTYDEAIEGHGLAVKFFKKRGARGRRRRFDKNA